MRARNTNTQLFLEPSPRWRPVMRVWNFLNSRQCRVIFIKGDKSINQSRWIWACLETTSFADLSLIKRRPCQQMWRASFSRTVWLSPRAHTHAPYHQSLTSKINSPNHTAELLIKCALNVTLFLYSISSYCKLSFLIIPFCYKSNSQKPNFK